MILCECPSCHMLRKADSKICSCGCSLTKIKKTYWVRVGVKTPTGYKQKKRRLGKVPIDVAREVEVSLRSKPSPYKTPRLSEVCNNYLSYLLLQNPRWAKTVVGFFSRAINYFGDVEIDRISPASVEVFRVKLREENLANATVNRILSCLRAAINRFGDRGSNNVFVLPRLPERDVIEYLTEEEESRLIKAAESDLFVFLILSIGTGLRKSEVLNLKRENVDFVSNTITVHQKGGTIYTKDMIQMVKDLLLSLPPNGTPYFFINPRTHEPYKDLKKSFSTAKAKAGIVRRFRQHGLRHHVAVKLLKQTGNLELIRDFLGHSEIATTVKYAKMVGDERKELLKGLNITLPGIVPKRVPKQIKRDIIAEQCEDVNDVPEGSVK